MDTTLSGTPAISDFVAPLDPADAGSVAVHFRALADGEMQTLICKKTDTRNELILRFVGRQRQSMLARGFGGLALIAPGGGDGSVYGKSLEDLGLTAGRGDGLAWTVVYRKPL